MTDLVARLRNKRAWDLGKLDEMDEAADEIERLRAERAAALQDAEDLNVEVEHYANLAIVDLGANPTVSWKERAEAAEAERDALRARLEALEEALLPEIDAALKTD